MSKVVVTARIDEETAAKLDQLAEAGDRSRSWLVTQAIKRYAEEESAYLEFILEGERSGEEGGWIPHATVMAEIDALLAAHKTAA